MAFDEHAGLGEIAAGGAGGGGGAGGVGFVRGGGAATRFAFHCTQIADGSRAVAVGTPVAFALLAARGGRWEAADILLAGGDG